jgi:hypothetical protein
VQSKDDGSPQKHWGKKGHSRTSGGLRSHFPTPPVCQREPQGGSIRVGACWPTVGHFEFSRSAGTRASRCSKSRQREPQGGPIRVGACRPTVRHFEPLRSTGTRSSRRPGAASRGPSRSICVGKTCQPLLRAHLFKFTPRSWARKETEEWG